MLFANFAEAIAEGRGKAQADSLRASRKDVDAHKIPSPKQKDSVTVVSSALLKKGEFIIVKAGEQIPADGEEVAMTFAFGFFVVKKLESEPDSPQYIQTHIGVGYRMMRVE